MVLRRGTGSDFNWRVVTLLLRPASQASWDLVHSLHPWLQRMLLGWARGCWRGELDEYLEFKHADDCCAKGEPGAVILMILAGGDG